jgi:septum formation protein
MLSKKIAQYRIILASRSPRRQEFLKELNIPYSIILFDVEETYPNHLKREEISEYIALQKSKPFDDIIQKQDLIITSDTIVWHEGVALGKPKNEKEAFEVLKSLSGKMHEVISSVCIKTRDKTKIITDATKVYFSELTDEEILFYIENHKPFDKAGSYGIQEWIGYIGVEKIEGSYFNVMGFPTNKFYKYLKELQ